MDSTGPWFDPNGRGELVLHRPRAMSAGPARRIHVYLDDSHVADLGLGDTARVPAAAGPHLVRARCVPLHSDTFPFILAAEETVRILVFVDSLDALGIAIDEPADGLPPAAR